MNSSEGSDIKAPDYFDILSWIESRIQSKTFSDIIKSNSRIKLSDLNF
ncbi:MAG: hypothetical protein R3A12_10920 [Ignavibacteria bacterium]